MPSYKCPGCKKFQGSWCEVLKHAKACCPGRTLIRKRCQITQQSKHKCSGNTVTKRARSTEQSKYIRPRNIANATRFESGPATMPKQKNVYKCPGCNEIQGKLSRLLNHAETCCPDLIENRKGLQKRCLVDKNSIESLQWHCMVDKNAAESLGRRGPRESTRTGFVKKIKNEGSRRCLDTGEDGKTRKRKSCKTFVDPQRLFFLKCIACGYSFDMSNDVPEYLWCRRRTRKERGLLSVTAPLDGPSCSLLSKVSMSCGIQSNTAMPHVTYMEGLLPDKSHLPIYLQQLKSLRMALLVDPSLKILDIHAIPRRSDDSTVLIVADVAVRPNVEMATRTMANYREGCVLPQFPFHVALGACSKELEDGAIEQASRRLLNVTLSGADSSQLTVLPPPVHDKLFLANNNRSQEEQSEQLTKESHEERVQDTLKKFPNIAVAMEAADWLNESLASAPVNTWKRSEAAARKSDK